LADADVLVENFSPGTMDRLGLGLASLRQRHPRLITASISLFGGHDTAGSLAHRGGLAIVGEAESSIMSQHRDREGRPITTPYGLGDMVSGLAAYGAIASGLFERTRTGVGRHLDIAMVRALLALNAISITGEQIDSQAKVGRTAGMGIFPAADGHVAIGVNSDSLFARLAVTMGRPDLLENPSYAFHTERDTHLEEIDAIVTQWTSSRSVDQVLDALSPTGVPCGRVNTPADILGSSTARQLSLFDTVEDGLGGTIRTPTDPFGFGNHDAALPRLGQDNALVTQHAFAGDAGAYEDLRRRGAFGPSDLALSDQDAATLARKGGTDA